MASSFFQQKLAFLAFLATKLLLLLIALPVIGQESGRFRPNSNRASSDSFGHTFSLVDFDDAQAGSESLPPKKNNTADHPLTSDRDDRPRGSPLGSLPPDQSPTITDSPYLGVDTQGFDGESLVLGHGAYSHEILGYGLIPSSIRLVSKFCWGRRAFRAFEFSEGRWGLRWRRSFRNPSRSAMDRTYPLGSLRMAPRTNRFSRDAESMEWKSAFRRST